MINLATIKMMQEMHLNAMAKQYREQCENQAYWDMSFESRFDQMVEAEWMQRKNNRIQRLLKNANLKYNNATLDSIDYHEDRKLCKETIMKLASCNYISRHQNIIIVGATGAGKTWLSCAFAHTACRFCISARYVRLPELLDELKASRAHDDFRKALNPYIKPKLLIIDEWLTSSIKESESRDIVELIEARSSTSSTIFCFQIRPEGWHQKMSKSTHADAILDRIIHNAYMILIEGSLSMRERYGIKNDPE